MPILYEWDIEEVDENEDIVDHNFRDKLNQFSLRELNKIDGKKFVLVLVRPDTETAYKGWAYAEKVDGEWKLPQMFLDAFQKPVCYIPEKFGRELSIMQGDDGKEWVKE